MLGRTVIFVPGGAAKELLYYTTNVGGLAALNITLALSLAAVAIAVVHAANSRRVLNLTASATIIALVVLDLTGVYNAYWALLLVPPLVVSVWGIRGLPAALLILFYPIYSYTGQTPLHVALQFLWLAAPLPLMSLSITARRLLAITIVSVISLMLTAANVYIMGQILVFGLGLLNPWLLAPAIILYSLAKGRLAKALLATGPIIQLLHQVTVIASLALLESVTRPGPRRI